MYIKLHYVTLRIACKKYRIETWGATDFCRNVDILHRIRADDRVQSFTDPAMAVSSSHVTYHVTFPVDGRFGHVVDRIEDAVRPVSHQLLEVFRTILVARFRLVEGVELPVVTFRYQVGHSLNANKKK